MRSIIFRLLIFTVLFHILQPASAQKDLLLPKAGKAFLSQNLLPPQKWIRYPAYADRESWNRLPGEQKKQLISSGEKYLGYTWQVVKATDYLAFERTGSRVVMEQPFNENSTALMHLFLAELAEGKGRFTDQIINGVWFFCEMSTWILSAHLNHQKSRRSLPDTTEMVIDLTSGDIGSMLSWIHYFFAAEFDKVNPVIGARLRQEVKKRVLDPYLQRNDLGWMALTEQTSRMVNNWNPWCNFNVLSAFLLIEKDPSRLTEAVSKSMISVDRFINYTKDDGACEEGPSYWGHAAGKLYDYLQLLYQASGGSINLFGEGKIRRMGEYIARSYIGDGWVVNFADASAKGSGDAGLIYRYGDAVSSEEMKQFAAYLHRKKPDLSVYSRDVFRTLEALWSVNGLQQTQPAISSAPFTWYPQTEFCYVRTSDAFFGAKGGYNAESHNHNDIGSFVYYIRNIPFLVDAGVGTYTRFTFSDQRYTIWTMQSDYHNLPKVNGFSQKDGRQYRSRAATFDSAQNRFRLDIAGAYEKETGIKKWILDYRIGKDGTLNLLEDFELESVHTPHHLHFLAAAEPTLQTPGKLILKNGGITAVLTYNPKIFDASVDPFEIDDVRLSRVWGNKLYRIILKDKQPRKKGKYEIRLTPQL